MKTNSALNIRHYHMKYLLIFLIILPLHLNAKNELTFSFADGFIKGTVIDHTSKNPLPFATVILKDSNNAYVTGGITDDQGNFELDRIPPGKYTFEIQFIGYENYTQAIEISTDQMSLDLGTIPIKDIGQNLEEITIKADKPLYVQKVDRMVINVGSSILSSGSTAIELLERSPGVSVNRQSGSISLVGKDGVNVMINGKISYMPQESIVQLLEGMSSDNIESIELITTPPANLDAEGNAGYINFVLKKSSDVGLNGSYSLSVGLGNGSTTQDNINFNYRKNKLNLYGNYSFLRRNQDQRFEFGRTVNDDFGNVTDLYTISYRDPIQRNHNFSLGLDYELTEKTIIGVMIDAYDQKWSMDAVNESVETENGNPKSFVELINDERNQWQYFGSNFNVKHNFKTDEYLSVNFDYLYWYNENPTNYSNSFYDENGDLIREELTNSDKTTPLSTFVSSADYSKQITEDLRLDTGVKMVLNKFENDVIVSTFDGEEFVPDPTLTNFSELEESIFALYASTDYNISKKTNAKLGLRYEHTNSELNTDKEGKVVDRTYGELFPSAFVTHQVNDSLGFSVSYVRRITRPTFNEMAPFVIFVDPTTFFSGNPAIQPAISNAFKFGTTYKSFLLSAEYSVEDESIARFQQRYDEENDRLIYESMNLDQTRIFSLTLGLPLKLSDWWRTQNTIIYLNTRVENTVDDVKRTYEQNTFQLNSIQSFKISETVSSEINLFYNGPSLMGSMEMKSNFFMNFGIQKKLGEKWGTLRFNINDIFDSSKFRSTSSFPDQNLNSVINIDFSNRTYLLTYSRNFGNKKLKSTRQRKTGSEEERRRVN